MYRTSLAVMLTALLASSTATAQKVHLDISNLADGTYQLVKVGTQVSVVPLVVVVPTTTTDPGNPPPPPPSNLQTLSESEAEKVGDPNTARRLAVGYSVVLELAIEGTYGTDDGSLAAMETSVGQVTDAILNTAALKTAWQPYRDAIGSALQTMTNEGELDNLGEYRAAVTEIRDGLMDSTVGASEAGLNLGVLLEIVQMVTDLLDGDFDLAKMLQLVMKVLTLFTSRGIAVDGGGIAG